MAIALRGTPTVASAIDGAICTITLPSGLQTGDVVYVFSASCDGNGGTSSSGWTEVGTDQDNGAQLKIEVFRKVMGVTPDTTFIKPSSGNNSNSQCLLAFAFSGVDNTTPEDGVALTTATGTSTTPDPAAITPTTTGAAVLIFAAPSRIADVSGTAAPANYGTIVQTSATDTRPSSAYGGVRIGLTGGVSENPGAFTGVTSATWITYTVAIKPSAAVAVTRSFGFVMG